MRKTSIIWKIPKEQLEEWVKASSTLTEILRKFGMVHKGGNSKTLKQRLHYDLIDYSHIQLGLNNRKDKNFATRKAISLEQVAIKNSTYSRQTLKKRLIKDGILKEQCNECGISVWNGKKLSLVLDHINGIANDHRIENLRLLCPNCNSQTETFAGRNSRKVKMCACEKCGKVKKNNSILCHGCANFAHRKVIHPSRDELNKLLWTIPVTQIAIQFGVSDKSVEKWCKQYSLAKPQRGYWQKNKIEMNLQLIPPYPVGTEPRC